MQQIRFIIFCTPWFAPDQIHTQFALHGCFYHENPKDRCANASHQALRCVGWIRVSSCASKQANRPVGDLGDPRARGHRGQGRAVGRRAPLQGHQLKLRVPRRAKRRPRRRDSRAAATTRRPAATPAGTLSRNPKRLATHGPARPRRTRPEHRTCRGDCGRVSQ